MKKCDFCKYSRPNQPCFWKNNYILANVYCERAIELMVKTLNNNQKEN